VPYGKTSRMVEYIEFNGIHYRKARAKYNGITVLNCLIPESEYKHLKNEKKQRTAKNKSPRKDISKLLDVAWSAKVKERDGFMCQKCGSKDKQLNSHHIFSRSHKSTRWDIDNGITLCAGCHTLGNGSAHKDPEIFRDWYVDVMGQGYYDKLKWKAYSIGKLSMGELEVLLMSLQQSQDVTNTTP